MVSFTLILFECGSVQMNPASTSLTWKMYHPSVTRDSTMHATNYYLRLNANNALLDKYFLQVKPFTTKCKQCPTGHVLSRS